MALIEHKVVCVKCGTKLGTVTLPDNADENTILAYTNFGICKKDTDLIGNLVDVDPRIGETIAEYQKRYQEAQIKCRQDRIEAEQAAKLKGQK